MNENPVGFANSKKYLELPKVSNIKYFAVSIKMEIEGHIYVELGIQ